MAPRTTDTKQRMVDAAADLLSQQGTAGTTIDAVLARSGAPRGSVYHHFPGGRNQLVLDAVQMVGDRISRSIDAATGKEPREALDDFAAFWRRMLVRTDYRSGCPVVALAVGGAEQIPGADRLVAEVFATWQAKFTALLTRRGVTPKRARSLANLVLSATQGAVVLCRAERSTAPLDHVVAELSELLAAAA
ncbi:MAG: TetR/AcrR family transcriptional regulator [Pseudonocardiales bacterium]